MSFDFNYSILNVRSSAALIFLLCMLAYSSLVYAQPGLPTKPEASVYVISTIDEPNGGYHSYVGNLSKLYSSCPHELVILVHGLSPSVDSALEEFDRAAMSLESNGYEFPVVGMLWPSQVFSLNMTELLTKVGLNADKGAQGLSQFLIDLKKHCSNSETFLHIVAHSAGASVVKGALVKLSSDNQWKLHNYLIETVDFTGAAIESKSPDIRTPFGSFLNTYVFSTENLYSPRDDLLPMFGPMTDLGLKGVTPGIPTTDKYVDENVMSQIIANNDANGDGKCDLQIIIGKCPSLIGENHLGYWGFRAKDKHLIDDGVMGVLTGKWAELANIYQPSG